MARLKIDMNGGSAVPKKLTVFGLISGRGAYTGFVASPMGEGGAAPSVDGELLDSSFMLGPSLSPVAAAALMRAMRCLWQPTLDPCTDVEWYRRDPARL